MDDSAPVPNAGLLESRVSVYRRPAGEGWRLAAHGQD
jgi:hypothetical protein